MIIQINRTQHSIDEELISMRKDFVSKVNEAIGNVRLKYITDIPGQALIYNAKEAEAIAANEELINNSGTIADLTKYPFIQEESVVTNQTFQEVVTSVLTNAALWRGVGVQLENYRMSYNSLINSSTTEVEMETHLETLMEVLNSL